MSCYMDGLALHESLYHNITVLSTSTKPSPQNFTEMGGLLEMFTYLLTVYLEMFEKYYLPGCG